MGAMIDITGKQFGTLIAVKPTDMRNGRSVLWECTCICEHWLCPKNILVDGNNLRAGNSTSCDKHRFPKDMHRAIRHHYTNTVSNARKRNYTFEVNPTQFHAIIKQPCYYCGSNNDIKRVTGFSGKSVLLRANGIDRKDNTLGYTLDNCVSCCEWCNRAKDILSVDDYIMHCKRVAEHNT